MYFGTSACDWILKGIRRTGEASEGVLVKGSNWFFLDDSAFIHLFGHWFPSWPHTKSLSHLPLVGEHLQHFANTARSRSISTFPYNVFDCSYRFSLFFFLLVSACLSNHKPNVHICKNVMSSEPQLPDECIVLLHAFCTSNVLRWCEISAHMHTNSHNNSNGYGKFNNSCNSVARTHTHTKTWRERLQHSYILWCTLWFAVIIMSNAISKRLPFIEHKHARKKPER